MDADPASGEQVGPWTVRWRPTGFSLRRPDNTGNGFFLYSRIILPIEIVVISGEETGHAVLKIDPFNTLQVLHGSTRPELERFKRRVSGEVLAAVKVSPFGCSDCATEAGMLGVSWNGDICLACREYCCRNPRCLRRLRLVVLRSGVSVCSFCGSPNEPRPRPVWTRAKRRDFLRTR
jgi:hypothetical protein